MIHQFWNNVRHVLVIVKYSQCRWMNELGMGGRWLMEMGVRLIFIIIVYVQIELRFIIISLIVILVIHGYILLLLWIRLDIDKFVSLIVSSFVYYNL